MLNEIYRMLDPVAFAVGPFVVRWYGIAYVAGFVCAALVLWQVAKRWKVRVDADSLLTVVLCAIVGVILGGRLGYVLVYGDGYYFSHPAEILAFSHGGMSFHGGLIGALLSGIVAARFTGIPYLTLADMGCVAAPIGLFFGRCANFVNGELWGAPTSLPWGVVFGGTAGVISLEDVLEQIFGEIEDEHDVPDLTEKQVGPDEYVLSCRLEVKYLNEKYGLGIEESREYDTLAGFIIFNYEGIPTAGETVFVGGLQVRILRTTRSRIDLARVRKL